MASVLRTSMVGAKAAVTATAATFATFASHREDDADQPKQRPEQLCQALGQELIQGVNVIGDATHEVAEWPTIEECKRQTPETLDQPPAPAGQHAPAAGPHPDNE